MNPASAVGALSAKGWRGSAVLVALGALGGLGHPPVSWPLATIAAFAAGCFALVNCRKQIDAVKVGWLFGVGYFAVSLIWIVEPFMVFPERDGWMAPFAIFFAAAGFGAFWGAGFWTAWKLGIGPGSRALALAGCIAAVGMLREELLTGFPWALPSYVWSDAPVAQALAVVGPHGLTFLTALAAFSPFLARKPWVGATIAAAGISVIWAAGSWRLASGDVEHADQARVRLVQPNVPQAEKWNAAMSEEFFQRLLSLSSRPSDDPVDLVIWPETAVTDLLRNARKRFPEMAASASGAYIVTGVRRHEAGRFYNSMIALNPEGELIGVYDKHHLVPFGEYVPFGGLLSDLGFNGLAADEGGPRMTLIEGNRHERRPGGAVSQLRFDRYDFDFGAGEGGPLGRWRGPRERFLDEIFFPAEAESGPSRGSLLVEGHDRLAQPLLNAALPLIAATLLLASRRGRRGRSKRIGAAAAILVVIEAAMLGAKSMGARHPEFALALYLCPLAAIAACLAVLGHGEAGAARRLRQRATAF